MKNNALNIVFIVIDSIEILAGVAISGAMLMIGTLMFLFSGVDGAPDERLSSALMIVFLAATLITALASLVFNIICIFSRKRNQKTGTELSKGIWITAISLGGMNLVFLPMFIISFLFVVF